MTTGGAELLRILGSGVRPDGASAPAPANQPVHGLDFASLLRKAEAGEAPSGRRIEVASDAGVALTDAQLERLAHAADAAEAAGSTRLLALIDGQAVIVNIVTRTVEGAYDPSGRTGADAVLTGVDAVMVTPGGEPGACADCGAGIAPFGGLGTAGGAPGRLAPPGGLSNRSLAALVEALAARGGTNAA